MKKLTPLALLLLLCVPGIAQNCTYELRAEVTAESGLTLRATPSLTGKVLSYVPAKSQILACKQKEGELVIEGIAGHWRAVQYQEFTGYMFDGYLSLPAMAKEQNDLDSLRARSQKLIRESDSILGNKQADIKADTAQETQVCNYKLIARVTAPSGLSFREKPELDAKLLATVPFKERVLTCSQTEGKLTVGEVQGFWRPVQYEGQKGYMFDGYLAIEEKEEKGENSSKKILAENQKPIAPHPYFSGADKVSLLIEAYNYCGDVEAINAGLLWYGVYPEKEEDGEGLFRIKPVELVIKLSTSKMSQKMEFDISTESDERSLFLIGLNRSLKYPQITIDDHSESLRMLGNRILPGQSTALGGGISLAATGSVESTGDCPELKNYRLLAKLGNAEQNLLNEIGENGACGMPELYWYGDLSGDGLPEIIFVSVYKTRNVFTLLKSKPNEADKVLEKAASFEIVNCTEQ